MSPSMAAPCQLGAHPLALPAPCAAGRWTAWTAPSPPPPARGRWSAPTLTTAAQPPLPPPASALWVAWRRPAAAARLTAWQPAWRSQVRRWGGARGCERQPTRLAKRSSARSGIPSCTPFHTAPLPAPSREPRQGAPRQHGCAAVLLLARLPVLCAVCSHLRGWPHRDSRRLLPAGERVGGAPALWRSSCEPAAACMACPHMGLPFARLMPPPQQAPSPARRPLPRAPGATPRALCRVRGSSLYQLCTAVQRAGQALAFAVEN